MSHKDWLKVWLGPLLSKLEQMSGDPWSWESDDEGALWFAVGHLRCGPYDPDTIMAGTAEDVAHHILLDLRARVLVKHLTTGTPFPWGW